MQLGMSDDAAGRCEYRSMTGAAQADVIQKLLFTCAARNSDL